MPPDRTFSFGSFRLFPAQRTLLRDDKPVRLGSRAFDILVELVTRAGQIVTKDTLISRVWPSVIVDEGSLRVHISALRRVLGVDRTPDRYIVNVPGRGYCFVAAVASSAAQGTAAALPVDAYWDELPAALTRMIGRSDIVASLIADLPLGADTLSLGKGRFVIIQLASDAGEGRVDVGARKPD